MNTVNNKRKRDSQEKIKKAFIEIIQNKELNQVSVMEIIKLAGINRSTFYANYLDIFDLAEKLKNEMFENLLDLYKVESLKKEHSYDYLTLFKHIKGNQIYYKMLFKLNFDFGEYYDIGRERIEALKYLGTDKNIEYHIEFFKSGLNAIIKKWLFGGCLESPEELNEILLSEYQGRKR